MLQTLRLRNLPGNYCFVVSFPSLNMKNRGQIVCKKETHKPVQMGLNFRSHIWHRGLEQ